jgi:hypothetical protein
MNNAPRMAIDQNELELSKFPENRVLGGAG